MESESTNIFLLETQSTNDGVRRERLSTKVDVSTAQNESVLPELGLEERIKRARERGVGGFRVDRLRDVTVTFDEIHDHIPLI
jgi:hypothetical protein